MNTILTILFVMLLTFIYGSMAGYVVHRLLHTKIFGKLAEGHNRHHTLYTVEDFESNKYRDAGDDDSAFVFIPIIVTAIVLMCIPLWFIFSTWWIYPIILAEGVFVGWLHDYIHESFHLNEHWLLKYKFIQRLKELHILHHKYPQKNHGIIWFIPDRLFRTFTQR